MSSTEDMLRRSLHARADLTTYEPTSALDVARRARASRRKRTRTVALVAAAALVTVGVPTGLMLGTSHSDRTGPPASPPTTSSPDATQGPAPAPKLISYDADGSDPAEVRTAADANNLTGAPDSFKEFIGRTAERLTGNTTCESGYVGVTIRALRTDGFAVGAVNECGGYVALWAIVDGDWKEIAATQDLWDCAVLTKHRVPSDIAGDSCYDNDVRAQRPYQRA